MLPILLLILQIVGAIPAIIDAVKLIWGLISTIQDRKTRLRLRVELRKAALSAVNQEAKTINDVATAGALASVHYEVLEVIRSENGKVLDGLYVIRDGG